MENKTFLQSRKIAIEFFDSIIVAITFVIYISVWVYMNQHIIIIVNIIWHINNIINSFYKV